MLREKCNVYSAIDRLFVLGVQQTLVIQVQDKRRCKMPCSKELTFSREESELSTLQSSIQGIGNGQRVNVLQRK